ncbi:uncharacterized protein LOC115664381 isoform X1 [Syzygium oleosum]|uniref:uncharacterized protein LOC115664381 isoform X1 n=1 Tax=Syzygium oleosum TaxID=219896 RepID=UPI0024B8F7A5|nr:uncharacterized protein LOC115664381 isoform X1 [Syzygium oleosum]
MALAARFLRPIRASLAASSSSPTALSRSKPPVRRAEFGIARAWFEGIRPAIRDHRVPQFSCGFSIRALCARSFGRAGNKVGTFISTSVIFGSVHPWPHFAFSLDGEDTVKNDEQAKMLDDSSLEDSPKAFWTLARKLWLPIFFLVTVLLNWDHPIELAMRSILFLLSTKPSPLSVYLPIEKLCNQSMHQDSDLYRLKSLRAKKVEVEDYQFFCLAKIESTGQKYILVGILGGWWPLKSFLWEGASLTMRNRDQKNG